MLVQCCSFVHTELAHILSFALVPEDSDAGFHSEIELKIAFLFSCRRRRVEFDKEVLTRVSFLNCLRYCSVQREILVEKTNYLFC